MRDVPTMEYGLHGNNCGKSGVRAYTPLALLLDGAEPLLVEEEVSLRDPTVEVGSGVNAFPCRLWSRGLTSRPGGLFQRPSGASKTILSSPSRIAKPPGFAVLSSGLRDTEASLCTCQYRVMKDLIGLSDDLRAVSTVLEGLFDGQTRLLWPRQD